ncbi:potassium channel family protein [Alkalihalobacillus hemicellulosilyticus]|uniref:Potassium channel protein n=1 Tax=Halalkalibacter hemicellulosilyticusJCM 9152 TaxID=1236971 RepID=W4QGV2_9BACI|nr:potassium channel family protein [Halalkalibacter hemicellulosilyticus]GAE31147.1 potassium channel protein [Halalkalibacter hemicellulosilyticusJCM 9152]
MKLIVVIILLISTVGTVVSLLMLLRFHPHPSTHLVSLRHFGLLILVYVTLISSFAILYTGVELIGIRVIQIDAPLFGETISMLDMMYFSAITMLSVGYGDIVPIGLGRLFAVVQSLIGFLLPAAFVMNTFLQAKMGR